jgi:5-methylcytosine-specific restriction endonuclease McrA
VADKSSIEWTDATWTTPDGHRRSYVRRNATTPGIQERRHQAAAGFKWCRGCRDWLPLVAVDARGACRPCLNQEYREAYATNPRAIRARVQARKRSIRALPVVGSDYLTEQFEGQCAYCAAPATTWDHVVPVALGGDTLPGNVVPACVPCNSSKKASDVVKWLSATGRTTNPVLLDVLVLAEVA